MIAKLLVSAIFLIAHRTTSSTRKTRLLHEQTRLRTTTKSCSIVAWAKMVIRVYYDGMKIELPVVMCALDF